MPESGFVFCCFNNNYKILPRHLKAGCGFSERWTAACYGCWKTMRWRRKIFASSAAGLDPGRLVFAGRLPLDEHLARHRLADLFLDTWPYNAHTTASDALWAGLPVLTRTGNSFASRVAASLLNALGLPDLITSSKEEYEKLAIALAKDPARLASLRKTLAENRTSAPLFDGKRIARHLEAVYEAIWARYQSGLPADHIDIKP